MENSNLSDYWNNLIDPTLPDFEDFCEKHAPCRLDALYRVYFTWRNKTFLFFEIRASDLELDDRPEIPIGFVDTFGNFTRNIIWEMKITKLLATNAKKLEPGVEYLKVSGVSKDEILPIFADRLWAVRY